MSIIEIRHRDRTSVLEFFICGEANSQEQAGQLLQSFCAFVEDRKALLPALRVFVKESAQDLLEPQILAFARKVGCPVTQILQPDHASVPALSLQAHAVCGTGAEPVTCGGKIVGCRYADEHVSFLHLNVLSDPALKTGRAADFVFETMQQRLRSAGSDFAHTVRTWLFVDDILSWYGQLNQARDRFFNAHDVFKGLVPASTGIGVRNSAGAALTTELLAACPLTDGVEIRKIASPLQCEALDYKSSFSRAVLVKTPGCKRLYVSGTASIAPGGQTAHLDDCARQVDLTMRVVEALIQNGGLEWTDTVQAIAYFKDAADFGLFDAYCRGAGLSLPHVKVAADVCRGDLLFELELTLVSSEHKSQTLL